MLAIGPHQHFKRYSESHSEDAEGKRTRSELSQKWNAGTETHVWLLIVRLEDQALAWRIVAQDHRAKVNKNVDVSYTGGKIGHDIADSIIANLLSPSDTGYAAPPGVSRTVLRTVQMIASRL